MDRFYKPGQCLNFYYDPHLRMQRTLYLRDREGAKWEREAIKDNWWQMNRLIPQFCVVFKGYKPGRGPEAHSWKKTNG